VGLSTVERVRKRFVEHGFEEALARRPQPQRPEKRILNGKHEAYLIALACGGSSKGHLLFLALPGRCHEHYFAEIGDPVANSSKLLPVGVPDVEKMIAPGQHCGIEVLPPSS
jgi:Homeodomain-like domain